MRTRQAAISFRGVEVWKMLTTGRLLQIEIALNQLTARTLTKRDMISANLHAPISVSFDARDGIEGSSRHRKASSGTPATRSDTKPTPGVSRIHQPRG